MVRRRTPTLKRRRASLPLRRRFILFTEGGLTEPEYFRHYARATDKIIVHIDRRHGTPETLLRHAKSFQKEERRRADSGVENDQIWLVFDRDEHPNINTVISGAGDVGIDVAFSNPCFEIWLILHFEEHDAYDNTEKVQRKLSKICNQYKKDSKTIEFDLLLPKIPEAEKRAERMAARRVEEGKQFGNPYTGVYRLTRQIMQG